MSASSSSVLRETGIVNITGSQFTLNASTGVLGDETRNTPALTREIAIPSPRADHDIYYHQLLTKRRGSPLWIPGPGRLLPIAYRKQGISIGDVGIFTHFGRFDFLFNIFQPADHAIHTRGVPDSFSPLDFGQLETDPSTIYGGNTYLTSSSVSTSSVSSSDLIFESTAQEAAILTMPDGALTEDLLNDQIIRKCIADNARTWYEYARCRRGRTVQNGEIRVVVGWDKARSWGIATSTCTSGQSASLTFKINDETGTSRAYCWQCIGSGSGRVGPPEDEISDLRGENDATPQNQCVFVRTMNFTLAGHIWDDFSASAVQQELVSRQDNLQGPASTHHNAGGGTGNSSSGVASSQHHQSSSVRGRSHTLQSVTFDVTEPGIVHPSSSIHRQLLENYPNATIAITQDADWISALTDEDTSMPKTEDLYARILKSRGVYERDGVVSIQGNTDVPSSNVNFSYRRPLSSLATYKTPRQDKFPMTKYGENRRRRPKDRNGDKIYGSMQGFIDPAHNRGDVVAFDNTVYMGNAGGSYEPPQVPSNRPKTQEGEDSDDYSGSLDDFRPRPRSGASFHRPMTGIVKEARGTGNATAFKRTIHHGPSRESTLIDSPVGSRDIQQLRRSHGSMQGFIDPAHNRDVIAFDKTVYMGNAGGSYEPPQVPSSRPKTQKGEDSDDYSGSLDDFRPRPRSGASFYGPMTGIVKETRDTGIVIANKRAIYGPSWESTLIDSPVESRDIQQRLRSQGNKEFQGVP